MKHTLIIALLVLAFSMPERGNALTIGECNKWCQEEKTTPLLLHCQGYIMGISQQRNLNCDMLRISYNVASTEQEKYRLKTFAKFAANDTGAAKVEATVKAFTNWADDHPEVWNRERSLIGMYTNKAGHFLDAWPCELGED